MVARGQRMMHALSVVGGTVTSGYTGSHRLLMMYGPGLPQRKLTMEMHLAKGGRVACWDLGYWDRDEAMRLSIDGLHPTATHLAMSPDQPRRKFTLREDADPNGPILLVGIGSKSCKMLGLSQQHWEAKALRRIARDYPGRRVLWRPKGRAATHLPGTTLHHGMPIEQALVGCSLVVTRHSNVAVDACIAGVPVSCEGGAAHALYADAANPTRQQRAQFLGRLSWWQWRPSEARDAWAWVERAVSLGEIV